VVDSQRHLYEAEVVARFVRQNRDVAGNLVVLGLPNTGHSRFSLR